MRKPSSAQASARASVGVAGLGGHRLRTGAGGVSTASAAAEVFLNVIPVSSQGAPRSELRYRIVAAAWQSLDIRMTFVNYRTKLAPLMSITAPVMDAGASSAR